MTTLVAILFPSPLLPKSIPACVCTCMYSEKSTERSSNTSNTFTPGMCPAHFLPTSTPREACISRMSCHTFSRFTLSRTHFARLAYDKRPGGGAGCVGGTLAEPMTGDGLHG